MSSPVLPPALHRYATERGAAEGRRWAAGAPRPDRGVAPWRLDDPSITMRRLATAYFQAFGDAVREK
jgi:hypothetical protein